MQHIYRFITYAILLLAASGCSLLTSQLDDAAKGAGKLVTFYCENVTVPEIREEFRAAVNEHASPHSVSVTCAQGGVPLTVGSPLNPGAHTMPTSNPYEKARFAESMKARELLNEPAALTADQELIASLRAQLEITESALAAQAEIIATLRREKSVSLAEQADSIRAAMDPVNASMDQNALATP